MFISRGALLEDSYVPLSKGFDLILDHLAELGYFKIEALLEQVHYLVSL
jgi:hypothetical protein